MILTFISVAAAFSQLPSRARIDIDGNSKQVGFTNFTVSKGSVRYATWMKPEQNERFLTCDIDIVKNTWTQVSVIFTPLASGEVSLQLKGAYWKKDNADKTITPVPVYIDAVTADGSAVVNGDFEDIDIEKNELKSWGKGGNEASWMDLPPLINTDTAFVKSGARSIRVWHNAVYSQTIKVTANTPVTIKAWVFLSDKQ